MTIRRRLQRLEALRMGGGSHADIHRMSDEELLALAGLPSDATDEQLAEVANQGCADPPESYPTKARKPDC